MQSKFTPLGGVPARAPSETTNCSRVWNEAKSKNTYAVTIENNENPETAARIEKKRVPPLLPTTSPNPTVSADVPEKYNASPNERTGGAIPARSPQKIKPYPKTMPAAHMNSKKTSMNGAKTARKSSRRSSSLP